MITFADRMYGEALNMLGSDPVDPGLQTTLDHLHDLADASHTPKVPPQDDCTWIPGHMAPACDWDRDCPVHGLEAVAGYQTTEPERTA